MTAEHPAPSGFEPGLARELEFRVAVADTAVRQGSGALEVLATPRLVAWMEAATCAVADSVLEPSRTSVGARVEIDHLAPSPVGARICVTATVTHVEARLVTFAVVALDAGTGDVVGRGEVRRAVVDRDRFLARLDR